MSETTTPGFSISKIYTKDISFESPKTPELFRTQWTPEVSIDLQTKHVELTENLHEIVLTVTATVKHGEENAFIAEVQQAGIFNTHNFQPEQLHYVLGSKCPDILFPYARTVVDFLVVHGGFPPLNLAPVNFDALYAQHMQDQKNTPTTDLIQ